jgi:solute carrier family 25 (adenine nucleotide translocator) protein 4/5/6/31
MSSSATTRGNPPPSHATPRATPQWREAVAGAAAGAFSKTAMAPVERVKLLLQLRHSVYPPPVATAPLATTTTTPLASPSAWHVAREVYQTQGFRSFWRGNLPSVWRTAGTAAVNFTCMDYYKRVAVQPLLARTILHRTTTHAPTVADELSLTRQRQFWSSLISGGLAGGTATTLMYPFEFLRTRLAMDLGKNESRQYQGALDVLRRIVRSDGVGGLFQGYGIALAGGIFYRVLFLGGYDALKNELKHRKRAAMVVGNTGTVPVVPVSVSNNTRTPTFSTNELSWGERIGAAQAISLSAGTLSYPFDSVRRRMMMQAGQAMETRRYRSSWHCITVVLRTEGIRGFFLGLGPNVIRSVGGAVLLVAYDSFRDLL